MRVQDLLDENVGVARVPSEFLDGVDQYEPDAYRIAMGVVQHVVERESAQDLARGFACGSKFGDDLGEGLVCGEAKAPFPG